MRGSPVSCRENVVSVTETDILDTLATIIDPELGMNIVDLGLVYDVQLEDGAVSISMTMTTPACPIAPHLVDQVRAAVLNRYPGLQPVDVQLVWEPAWDPLMMSWNARTQLGWA